VRIRDHDIKAVIRELPGDGRANACSCRRCDQCHFSFSHVCLEKKVQEQRIPCLY
jgi:hypothetical protein